MSAAVDLTNALYAIRVAKAAVEADPLTAAAAIAHAERVISSALEEYTPVHPAAEEDVRAARKASGQFRAADVAAILAEGKRTP